MTLVTSLNILSQWGDLDLVSLSYFDSDSKYFCPTNELHSVQSTYACEYHKSYQLWKRRLLKQS